MKEKKTKTTKKAKIKKGNITGKNHVSLETDPLDTLIEDLELQNKTIEKFHKAIKDATKE